MKSAHKIICAAAVVAFCASTALARSARDFFIEAPADVVPLLERNTRLDMLDYYNAGLPTISKNVFGGDARISDLADRSVAMQLSRDASLQIGLNIAGADTTIVVVETVLTPLADSSVRFFNPDWSERPAPQMPGIADFIAPENAKEAQGKTMPQMLFVLVRFDADIGVFEFHNNSFGYYETHDAPDGLPLMKTMITRTYDGKKFK